MPFKNRTISRFRTYLVNIKPTCYQRDLVFRNLHNDQCPIAIIRSNKWLTIMKKRLFSGLLCPHEIETENLAQFDDGDDDLGKARNELVRPNELD